MNTEIQNFAGLGLAEPLLRAIDKAGYQTPTPIQAMAIPLILAGGDLLAAAQTGTGKTAGFTLPILHRLMQHGNTGVQRASPKRPRCLILTPTRELAAQVHESVTTYGAGSRMRQTVVFGGVNINPQIRKLASGVEILVATPGRLLDHASQKTVDLSAVEILVLDEADRMLDMGFIHDIKRIMRLLPATRQNLLFSATFSDEIRQLAAGLLNDPQEISVARRNKASELVAQQVYVTNKSSKRELLSYLIGSEQWSQVLVFTRTKHGANRLSEQLNRDGIRSMAIHGNKSQGARTKALAEFKAGRLNVLVATDIAARGLDIVQLPHVVNYELPNVAEDYVHRIGRTGRAGVPGHAVSLVDLEEVKLLRAIEKLTAHQIEVVEHPGYTIAIPKGGGAGHSPAPRRARTRPASTGRRADPRKPNAHSPKGAGPKGAGQKAGRRRTGGARAGR